MKIAKDLKKKESRTKYLYQKKTIFLHIALIATLGFIVYSNSLNGKFIWDDIFLVKDNIYIKNWTNLPKIFSSDIGTGGLVKYSFYRPLQMFTYMIDYSFWGLNVKGYHLTNIFLHILTAVCIYWLVSILFKEPNISLLTGLLFVVHPIHTEAVSYISGRADPLVAMFIILSLIFYIKYLAKKSVGLYIIILLTYLLAILSKELSLMFPILLLFYHYVFKVKLKINYILGIMAVTFSYILLRLTVFNFFLFNDSFNYNLLQRIPGFFVALTNYLVLLFFPFNLHMDYGRILFNILHPKAILGIVLLIIFLFLAFREKNRNKLVFVCIGWFFITLLLQSNIYLLNAYMAEHWLYLPSIGFFLILSSSLNYLYQNKKLIIFSLSIIIALLTFFSALTIKQNRYWRAPLIFYERTLRYVPDSEAVLIGLGNVYKEIDRIDDAVTLYKKIIEIDPKNSEAYLNLGNIFSERGDRNKAISLYKKSIELNSNFVQTYNNLASLYRSIDKHDEAISLYKEAIRINPDYSQAYYNLGVTYTIINKNKEAITVLKEAIKVNPNYDEAYNKLALIYKDSGNYVEAIDLYEKAIKISPRNAIIHNNLGNIYKELGRLEKAEVVYKKTIDLKPNYAEVYNNLGIVYRLMDRNEEAIDSFKKSIQIKPDFADAHNNLAVTYYYKGQYDLAIAHSDMATKIGYRMNPEFLKLIEALRK